MNENKRSPVERLTDALADMSILAIEMEQERDEARDRENEWYQNYLRKSEQLKETERLLAIEMEEHRKTKQAFREAVEFYENRAKAPTHAENTAQTDETTASGQSIDRDGKEPTGRKNKPVRL